MATPNASGQAAKPTTFNELVAANTIFNTGELQEQTCLICDENYATGPKPELALKLPACGHTFGIECMKTWLNENKNTCPMCRTPVLNIPEPPVEELGPEFYFFNFAIDEAAHTMGMITETYLDAEHLLRNMVEDPASAFRPGLVHVISSYVQRPGSSLAQDENYNPHPLTVRNTANGIVWRFTNAERVLRDPNDNIEALLEALNLLHGMTHVFELYHDHLHAVAEDDDLHEIFDAILQFLGYYLDWEERFKGAMRRARGSAELGTRYEVLDNLFDMVDAHMSTEPRLREVIVDHHYYRREGDLEIQGPQ